MTFSELIQTCADDFGKETGEWIGRYRRFLNRGLQDVANYADWPFLLDLENTFNTVAGTEEYTLAETDNRKLINIRITTTGYRKRLSNTSYDAFRGVHPAIDTTADRGTPSTYYTTGRTSTNQLKIKLFPVPDQVYAIAYDYYRFPTTATGSNTNSSPEIPEPYQQILLDYVLAKCYKHERDFASASVYEKSYKDGLMSMASDIVLQESSEQHFIEYAGQAEE